MIDFLVGWMQALCILGLACGAYYSIRYGAVGEESPGERGHTGASSARAVDIAAMHTMPP